MDYRQWVRPVLAARSVRTWEVWRFTRPRWAAEGDGKWSNAQSQCPALSLVRQRRTSTWRHPTVSRAPKPLMSLQWNTTRSYVTPTVIARGRKSCYPVASWSHHQNPQPNLTPVSLALQNSVSWASAAPGPSRVPYKIYKQCPRLMHRLWRLIRILWGGGVSHAVEQCRGYVDSQVGECEEHDIVPYHLSAKCGRQNVFQDSY